MKLFFPFTVSVNKCGGSCHTIKDLYPWVCYKYSKNMNVKVFYLKSVVNEQDLQFNIIFANVNVDWIKVYIIQRKN